MVIPRDGKDNGVARNACQMSKTMKTKEGDNNILSKLVIQLFLDHGNLRQLCPMKA